MGSRPGAPFTDRPSERRFRQAIRRLHRSRIYPSGEAINALRPGSNPGRVGSLNGDECDWRSDELQLLGWTYRNPLGPPRRVRAWLPPVGWNERRKGGRS